MIAYVPWSSTESLGSLSPDASRAFRIRRILFGIVRDRCGDIDLDEGLEIRCRARTSEQIAAVMP